MAVHEAQRIFQPVALDAWTALLAVFDAPSTENRVAIIATTIAFALSTITSVISLISDQRCLYLQFHLYLLKLSELRKRESARDTYLSSSFR